jgi:cation diffusion facilitator family transporter
VHLDTSNRPPGQGEAAQRLLDEGTLEIQRVTWISVGANLLLTIAKLIGGLMTGSISLVADGVHSFSDFLTDFVVVLAARIGARPPDKDHPWGHGKFETLGALLVSVAIVLAGAQIGWKAGSALARGQLHFPGPAVLIIAFFSIVTKEFLYRITLAVGRKTGSQVCMANAWHHRSDAASSVVVFFGGAIGLAGVGQADQVAGIIVGLMVAAIGIRYGGRSLRELLEGSADEAVQEEIGDILRLMPGVLSWHQLRTRHVGRELHVDVHVVVSPDLSVREGHNVAQAVEDRIQEELKRPCDVIVHIDPEGDEREPESL